MSEPGHGGRRQRQTCLFTFLAPRTMAPFVRKDYEILSSQYGLRQRFYKGTLRGIPDRMAIGLGVLLSDFSYSYFGYTQAYWAVKYAKRFGKKSVVVLAGFDICEEEDPRLRERLPAVRHILKNADLLLAVSKRVRDRALEIDGSADIELLYHGLDAEEFRPQGQKERMALTVGYVNKTNLARKGLEVFVRSASLLPEFKFLMVGKWVDDSIDKLRSIATPNVSFLNYAEKGELSRLYQRASVYVQASMHECFGISMAEAMLSECAPVVSDRGAIPEVVGDTGVYVDPLRSEDVARGVKLAMDDARLGPAARERVASLFPLKKRRDALLSLIEELVS